MTREIEHSLGINATPGAGISARKIVPKLVPNDTISGDIHCTHLFELDAAIDSRVRTYEFRIGRPGRSVLRMKTEEIVMAAI
jgi:hypothetical protein